MHKMTTQVLFSAERRVILNMPSKPPSFTDNKVEQGRLSV
jgi:hypothetical protein